MFKSPLQHKQFLIIPLNISWGNCSLFAFKYYKVLFLYFAVILRLLLQRNLLKSEKKTFAELLDNINLYETNKEIPTIW